jgi:aspartokinase/homoserine dehydrogenase 1
MKRTPGIAGKLFGTLGRAGISVIACAQGASETNISFVIKLEFLRKALNSIHDSFFLSEYKVLNIFIVGVGTVGGHLLEQIERQQQKLMNQNGVKLNVAGVANSKKVLLKREGLDLKNCIRELKANGMDSSPSILRDEIIKMNIFNAIFVDCTSSEKIAALYETLLNKNISIVAANKLAASSSYKNYSLLKDTARKRGIKYLFETNVGAGLPVINTMNDLINSGDNILKLEAVLSGTLNFILNTIAEDIPFSKAVKMAVKAGYAEPDPRIDLSGKDVLRKLVILAREAGYIVEQKDVKMSPFIPEKYLKGSIEDFWKSLPELDAEFEEKRRKLSSMNRHLRYVASMNEGNCKVGFTEVDSRHPFYELEGSNNIIMISTERYHDYPMIIKGYGAGAEVTAAGVFADIISIANIR